MTPRVGGQTIIEKCGTSAPPAPMPSFKPDYVRAVSRMPDAVKIQAVPRCDHAARTRRISDAPTAGAGKVTIYAHRHAPE